MGKSKLQIRCLLVIVIACLSAHGAAAACSLRLDVNTTKGLAFTGSSAASMMPGAFPVEPKDPNTQIGLSGAMYLTIEAEKCPTSLEGWLRAAPSMRITSAPSPYVYKPLMVYPEALFLAVLGVPLNMSNLAVNMSITGTRASSAAVYNPVRVGVDAEITDGFVFSDTVMTGGPQLQPMTEQRSSSLSKASIAVNKEGPYSYLAITLTDFNITFVGHTSGVVGGKAWQGTMTFSLTGPLQLTGLLSCPKNCGDFGRCVAVNSSSSKYACECECGWTVDRKTGRCEVPSGTCPLYGSSSTTRSLSLVNTSSSSDSDSSSCSGGESVMAAAGACPNTYGYDVFTKTCAKCETDWGGPGCKMCTTDKACQAKLGKNNAICSTGLTYNERSQEKVYSCALNNPSIARIIGPVLPLTCKTGGGGGNGKKGSSSALAVNDASLLGSQATCSITMRLVGMPPGTSAMCTATGCHFYAGNPSFVCDGVACDCPQGCPPSYLKTFKDVSGSVTLDCDVTGQDCTIVIGSLNMKISASCEASECLDPTGPKAVGTGQQQQDAPPIAPPLLAALPLLLLLLSGLTCLLALARYKPYLCSRAGSSTAVKHTRTSSGSSSGSDPAATTAVPFVAGAAKGSGVAVGGVLHSRDDSTPMSTVSGGVNNNSLLGRTSVNKNPGKVQFNFLSFTDVTADVKVAKDWRSFLRRRRGQADALSPAAAAVAAATQDLEKGDDAAAAAAGTRLSHNGLKSNGVMAIGDSNDVTLGGGVPRGSWASGSSSSGSGDHWRPVLRGVSGCVASGQVLGVMGPSGGGKSTLLLKLCGSLGAGGRGSDWRSGGVISLDGVIAPPSLLAAVTALVPQDDSLMRSLTVEECLRYSAALRLDPSLPPDEVGARVEGVMATLGLTHIRGSTVLSGTGVSGVSGGERRRVGIGMELVIDPQILVLDEPLSGLDAFTALQLMKTLKAVAASGRVVALSLHQPTPALFGTLDTAMLLAAGLLVYAGPPTSASAALESLGCPVPQGITVAEHMLHVVSDPDSLQVVVAAALRQMQRQQQMLLRQGSAGFVSIQNSRNGSTAHTRNVSCDGASLDQVSWSLASVSAAQAAATGTAGKQQQHGAALQQQNSQGLGTIHTTPAASGTGTPNRNSCSGSVQGQTGQGICKTSKISGFKMSVATFSPRASASGQARIALGLPEQKKPLGRQIGVLFWRGLLDMLRNPLLTAFHSVGGLLLGLLVGVIFFSVKNDTSGAQNRVGAIFFALCLLAFTSVTSVDLVQAEAGAAGREMQRKYYSPVAYAVTKIVLDGLLLRALPAVLFALPFYFLMGLNTALLQFFVFLLVLISFSAAVGALSLGFSSALDSPGKTILVMNMVLLLGVLFGGFLANKSSIPVWLRWVSWLSVFRYSWEALVINELSGIDLFLSAPGVSLSLPVRGEVFLEIIGVQSKLFLVDIAVLVGMYIAACVFVVVVVSWRNRQRKH